MTCITISRQYGSYGDAVAELLRERLSYRILDKHLMRRLAAEAGLTLGKVADWSEDQYHPRTLLGRLWASAPPPTRNPLIWAEYGSASARDQSVADLSAQLILAAYDRGNVVIVGRGGQVVLRDKPDVLHVRLLAPPAVRVRRHQIRAGLDVDEARSEVLERDRASAEFVKRYHGVNVDDPSLYDLIINTAKLPWELATDLIVAALAAPQAKARHGHTPLNGAVGLDAE
jgi:cytidylate kinase